MLKGSNGREGEREIERDAMIKIEKIFCNVLLLSFAAKCICQFILYQRKHKNDTVKISERLSFLIFF